MSEPTKCDCHNCTQIRYRSSFLGQFDAALRAAEQQQEKPQPLYYVRQPDGSFTVAEPQPIFQETHR